MRRTLAAALPIAFVVVSCGAPLTAVAPDDAWPSIRWNVSEDETRSATLGGSDPVDAGGFYVERYELTVHPGDTYRFVLRSGAFDTVIRLTGPDGLELRNDDFWDGTNSMLQFQARERAGYLLEVTSYAPESTGLYELAVFVRDEPSAADTIPPGEPWLSRADDADDALGTSGTGWLHLRAGERVRLRVTSTDFDTTAWLFAPDGHSWFNDDANDDGPDGSESNLDSTIEAIAPEEGWYQVVVAPYDRTNAGMFRVLADVRPPVVVGPGEEIPTVGYAGSDSAGRIFGVYAGITDYGADDQLFGCADDATFLAQAFRHRHLQAAADQVVLTNKAATVDAFTRALREVAAKAGPDDVVVIFFSGHGGVEPVDTARDRVELDGTDETLVLIDGSLRDNDFAAILDTMKADTIVVALDSCQSGGFARDIMTRPGRIGLFSSDEDVLSATAEPVGAGGYLSYLMRRAVLGDADSRPADGALVAGELADFMIEGSVELHRDMNPEGAMDPLQRILVERGSYGWTDLLWVFPRNDDGTAIGGDLCLESAPAGEGPTGGGVCR